MGSSRSEDAVLFTPLRLRDVVLPNRIAVSPMCQYCAVDGLADDWHLVHLGRFAIGGVGLVMVEATAVEARGRISHGDLGLYDDTQIAPLRRIASFLRRCGSVPGIQLGHAGRKASMQRAWRGNGPLTAQDHARGDLPWPVIGPSSLAAAEGWPLPREMTQDDVAEVIRAWVAAAERADRAGFDVLEVHAAHGYLLHSFMSPLSNRRGDDLGGDFANRVRFLLQVVRGVRRVWPPGKPLFVRISATDGIEGGWTLEESLRLAPLLYAEGVDLIDCSSGGLATSATAPGVQDLTREPGFQIPLAAAIRERTGGPVMAVGLILDAEFAEATVRNGRADVVAIGRGALDDPNWPEHARRKLMPQTEGTTIPPQVGWWMIRWLRLVRRFRPI